MCHNMSDLPRFPLPGEHEAGVDEPYVSDTDDDIPTGVLPPNPPSDPSLELEVEELDPEMWDDDSDDDTLAVMAAGMDPDAHMNYVGHRGYNPDRLSPLEDRRERTLLQVTMAAQEVVKDAEGIMHQEIAHYLVDKELIDTLREALLSYKGANEDYIGSVDGTDATSTTKEL